MAPVRGQRVLLDADLAAFFGVSTKRLNERVRRSPGRFPEDFAFRLTEEEGASRGRPRRAVLPRAFTARGVLTLAGVLRGHLAEEASVFLVRAFILLSNSPPSPRVMRNRLQALERSIGRRNHSVRRLLAAVRLMALPGGRPAVSSSCIQDRERGTSSIAPSPGDSWNPSSAVRDLRLESAGRSDQVQGRVTAVLARCFGKRGLRTAATPARYRPRPA